MALVLNGDGNVTGLTPGGLPDASITQSDLAAGVAGNGPIFMTTMSAGQTLTSSTWTKLAFDTEVVDSHSNYDTSLYRFRPSVPGYYQFSAQITSGSGVIQAIQVGLYKNGSQNSYNVNYLASVSYGDDLTANITKLIYLNGTTDYVEAYGLVVDASVGSDLIFGGLYCHFEGFLARAS